MSIKDNKHKNFEFIGTYNSYKHTLGQWPGSYLAFISINNRIYQAEINGIELYSILMHLKRDDMSTRRKWDLNRKIFTDVMKIIYLDIEDILYNVVNHNSVEISKNKFQQIKTTEELILLTQ
jgi:hypothetical protein